MILLTSLRDPLSNFNLTLLKSIEINKNLGDLKRK